MKKKHILFIILLSMSFMPVYALSNSFSFDTSKFSFIKNSKNKSIVQTFNKDYHLTSSIKDENKKLKEEIKNLTKKTTYLLFGEPNNKNESSENYYKRKKEWSALRYDPEIPKAPKTNDNPVGLDMNSEEFKDDIVSGMASVQIFNQIDEMDVTYSSYGDINVTIGENIIISTITLPNVRMKEQSDEDPMQYKYVEQTCVMTYFYKKIKNEWKLYNLYGEYDDPDKILSEVEAVESKTMAIAPSSSSKLKDIYNFEKLNKMTEHDLENIYNANIGNIVFFNSYYNNIVVASANGFFINDGLIVTTWSFLEKALTKGQYITVKGNNEIYEIEGIVTANLEADIAVIKVKNNNHSHVKLGNYKNIKIEDPAIVISSKSGVGSALQKGIVISNNNYIQTSIALSDIDEGSPLLSQNGEVIGINTSKSNDKNMSIALNSDILREVQDKFSSKKHDQIKTISFKDLKEKYYYVKYSDENIYNKIPKRIWKKYSKIGNIEKTIKLELVKASYKNGIVSLRYKNSISQYINSMQLMADFKEQLITDGYKEVMNDTSKSIYKNNKYQITIMDEFDYLIVVMVKV